MTKNKTRRGAKFEFFPLSFDRWADFETLFGERGACGGCWCMWWRFKRSEFERNKGAGNKKAMKAIVRSGQIPGILAFADGRPVGWCAVTPRDNLPGLDRSRILKRVDDTPVWSVACFFIDKDWRNQGLSVKLLKAAVEYVKRSGGTVLEGYPVAPKKGRTAAVFAWTGLAAAFAAAGFEEVERRSATRPIMRYFISSKKRNARRKR